MADEFNFGEPPTNSQNQSTIPYDFPRIIGIDNIDDPNLKTSLERIIPELNRAQALTIPSGDTTFETRGNIMIITGAAAVTIATITRGYNGQILTLIFTDGNITITDAAGSNANNSVELNSAFTSAANGVLQLVRDENSWYEIARSATITLTTPISLANGGTATALVDPGADRILFWDDSDTAVDWLTPGSGISITVNTLRVDRYLQMVVFDFVASLSIGDGKFYAHIDNVVGGMDLVYVHARVITAGTTNTTDIQIANVTQAADMLSTKITIDSGETGSNTAATPAVIDTANDDVAENDVIRIDVDAVSTTAPVGLIITLGFRTP